MADRDLITVDISDVLDWTRDLLRKSKDARPLMDEIAGLLSENVSENFKREEGSEGPWPELAEATKDQREKKGYGREHPMLIRERLLQSSIQPFSSAKEAGVGSNRIYSPIHNFGGKAGPGRKVTIPQREFMWLRDEYGEDIDIAAADFFGEDS